ncbi:DarT ssDNA thymidine ADP-ribosyltransferase family protein [Lactobacillus sp. AN1001]
MDQYQEIIRKRNITRLCHFTQSKNLIYILGDGSFEGNGLISNKDVRQEKILEVQDKNRHDGHPDYVCCSVQRVNRKLLMYRKKAGGGKLFNDWAVIYIDPSVISDTSLFCPVNAATGSGKYVARGSEAFESLFADELLIKGNTIKREPGTPANITTDVQAEVLIKDKIPREYIQAIGFPAENLTAEKQRLTYWCDWKIPIVQWEE